MRRLVIPFTLIGSIALASPAALAQAGGASSGGGSASGASSSGAGSAASSGTAASIGAPAPAAPLDSTTPGSGPAPGSAAVPPSSASPNTGDVSSGSAVPRARTGAELGAGQPGEGTARPIGPNVTGSISGRAQGTASPEQVRDQNERDRAINQDLLSGGGICEDCGELRPRR